MYCARRSAPERDVGHTNGKPSSDSGIPADIMQLFGRAQRNLMEVNRSRLDALQELGAARARITELGAAPNRLGNTSSQDPPADGSMHTEDGSMHTDRHTCGIHSVLPAKALLYQ